MRTAIHSGWGLDQKTCSMKNLKSRVQSAPKKKDSNAKRQKTKRSSRNRNELGNRERRWKKVGQQFCCHDHLASINFKGETS